MKINPTFGIVNKVVTLGYIPRIRMINCIQLSVLMFGISGYIDKRQGSATPFKAFAVTFVVLWMGFFVAFLKDPRYITYLWRSIGRRAVMSCVTVSRSGDRSRIQNV